MIKVYLLENKPMALFVQCRRLCLPARLILVYVDNEHKSLSTTCKEQIRLPFGVMCHKIGRNNFPTDFHYLVPHRPNDTESLETLCCSGTILLSWEMYFIGYVKWLKDCIYVGLYVWSAFYGPQNKFSVTWREVIRRVGNAANVVSCGRANPCHLSDATA